MELLLISQYFMHIPYRGCLDGQNFCGFHGLKHNCESFTAKQVPQGYLVVQISISAGRESFTANVLGVFTAKLLPSETYPLYGNQCY